MMKRIIFALATAAILALSAFVGCGGGSSEQPSGSQGGENKPAQEGEGGEGPGETEAPAITVLEGDKGQIVIWAAEAVTDFTKEKVLAFFDANPDYKGYGVTIEPIGEGDAATNMITDVEGGADIFGFAQDQLARLVAAGGVSPIMGDDAAWITAQNDAGAVGAATVGDTIYAYPMTSDNGYFLYYDKSVVKDPSTLEGIIADCEAAGKGFYFEMNSGWYQTAFFFGTGCELTYDTDNDGNVVACHVDYASDKGVAALKKLVELHKSSMFNNGSSVSNAANCAAIISGTWDSEAAQKLFGENYATAKLPTFTVGDASYQMSGFGGFKLLGIKPQTDAGKLAVVKALAKYLTGTEIQLARFEAVGWGPSNLEAQANDAIAKNPALAALAEQLVFTIPQGQYPQGYWDQAKALGDSILAGDFDAADDAKLMEVLTDFQNKCISFAK